MATPTEHDREALVKRLGRWADLPVPELAKDVREAIAALTAQGGEQPADTVSVPREPETWFSPYPIWTNMRSSVGVVKKSDYDKLRAHAVAVTAERDAMREWERMVAVALGVPGCNAAEMLNVIDGLREDAERYRWLKENTILREQKENMRFVWEFPNWLTRSGDYPYTRNDSIDAAIDAAMRNANET